MAWIEDVATMDTYRKIRRASNTRLAKALREGRLAEELQAIERKWKGRFPATKAGKKSRHSIGRRRRSARGA